MTACASDCEFRRGGKLRLCDPRLLPDEGLEGYVRFRYRRYQWCCSRSTRGGLKERPYRPPQRHIPLWDWISRCFDERPSILGGCQGCWWQCKPPLLRPQRARNRIMWETTQDIRLHALTGMLCWMVGRTKAHGCWPTSTPHGPRCVLTLPSHFVSGSEHVRSSQVLRCEFAGRCLVFCHRKNYGNGWLHIISVFLEPSKF
jgi:hypothetical protein